MLLTHTTESAPHTPVLAETATASRPATRQGRYGVHLVGDGVDVAVHAAQAQGVDFCLLEENGAEWTERRIALLPGHHGRWSAWVPGVRAGQRYGFRVRGPWDPSVGHFHNPHKLLVDPYARGIVGSLNLVPAVYAHEVDAELRPMDGLTRADDQDSALHVPHSVVIDDHFDGAPIAHPRVSWSETVIYEAHVRGLTMKLEGVPEHLRGTYAGLAHPVTVAHLRSLGVTSIELLPIHAKVSEPALTRRGAVNYWGYNTLGFFAPEPSYATESARAAGANAVLAEVKGMVKLLHEAGIEVLLDVVYNHTCEAGPDGPTLSWRGLDNTGYYLHDGGGTGRYYDVTGCGNSLDFRSQRVVQMTLDSLRYWVQEVGVDGFRFDLAVTLGRQGAKFLPDHPFLVALAADPVLAETKLIAEPWDVGPGGWRTGQFLAPMTEWNDRYRDVVRTFWLSDAASALHGSSGHDLRDLATRLAGSADMFSHTDIPGGRGPAASINFVTAHDGFTLADLTAYNGKHNEGNGEDNRDGSDNNRSWNHGVEGVTDDPAILASRQQSMRNILGTLLVSAGTPMLTAGDEIGRTQHGNNNAYCRDDDLAWIDWNLHSWQGDLLATAQHLLALRRENPVLRPARFRTFAPHLGDRRPLLAWHDEHGVSMTLERWHDASRRVLQMLRGTPEEGGRDALVVVNGAANAVEVTLTSDGAATYELAWDSAWTSPAAGAGVDREAAAGSVQTLPALSLRIYLSR